MIDPRALFGPCLRTYADRESWLADRAGDHAVPHRLGGSDVAAILADDAFGSPWSLYAERVLGHRAERTPQDLKDLRRGQILEPTVRAFYEEETGRPVVDMTGTRLHHPDHPWAVASLDGIALDDGEPGVWEGKTDRIADGWGKDGAEVWTDPSIPASVLPLPARVFAQTAWYLIVSGLPWADATVFLPWFELRTVRVHADPDGLDLVFRAVAAWRDRHLVRGEAPPVDGSEACRRALPRAGGKDWRHASAEQADLARAAWAAEIAHRDAESERNATRNRLIASMGDAYGLRLGPDGPRVYRDQWNNPKFSKEWNR